jgi:hypothetical protein
MCPAFDECRTYLSGTVEEWGVWAGTTERDRGYRPRGDERPRAYRFPVAEVQALIEGTGLPMGQVAVICGLGPDTISAIVHGQRAYVQASTATKIQSAIRLWEETHSPDTETAA